MQLMQSLRHLQVTRRLRFLFFYFPLRDSTTLLEKLGLAEAEQMQQPEAQCRDKTTSCQLLQSTHCAQQGNKKTTNSLTLHMLYTRNEAACICLRIHLNARIVGLHPFPSGPNLDCAGAVIRSSGHGVRLEHRTRRKLPSAAWGGRQRWWPPVRTHGCAPISVPFARGRRVSLARGKLGRGVKVVGRMRVSARKERRERERGKMRDRSNTREEKSKTIGTARGKAREK